MKPKLTILITFFIILSFIALSVIFNVSRLSAAQGADQVQTGAKQSVSSQAAKAAASRPIASKEQQSKEQQTTAGSKERSLAKAPSKLSHKVIAYYFHGKFRCPSCKKIEAYAREAIEGQGGFADLIKSGDLEWRVVNVEEPGNEHFIKDFQLYTKSLIIVDIRDGEQKQWKNLAKVWELLYDKEAFVNYVRDEIKAYLGRS